MSINELTIDQHGTRREFNVKEHGEIKVMHGYTRVVEKHHGTKGTRINIKVARKKLNCVSIFHLDGWMLMPGTNWILFLLDIIL